MSKGTNEKWYESLADHNSSFISKDINPGGYKDSLIECIEEATTEQLSFIARALLKAELEIQDRRAWARRIGLIQN